MYVHIRNEKRNVGQREIGPSKSTLITSIYSEFLPVDGRRSMMGAGEEYLVKMAVTEAGGAFMLTWILGVCMMIMIMVAKSDRVVRQSGRGADLLVFSRRQFSADFQCATLSWSSNTQQCA